jgi:TolB protein
LKLRNLISLTCAATALSLAVFAATWPAAGQESPPERGDDDPLPARTVVLDVDSPERALYKVAIPRLTGAERLGAMGAEVLRTDLRLVSLFEVLDPRSFVADPAQEGLDAAAWSAVGAQGVIRGQIERSGGRMTVRMQLYELARGTTPSLSRTYRGAPGELRTFMHQFANEVLEILTGRRGAFGSRLTFARRRDAGRKDIMVGGFDGHGVRRVSSGVGISMLPSFGRGGIWYSILTDERMFITRTGVEEAPIVESSGLNMGVRACGNRLYFTSTRDGNAEIYSSDLDGDDLRRLTNDPAIDVSPTCPGPSGQIAFVSNRHGSPQIFTMSPGGGGATRVTYRGNHNQTPAWCPVAEDGPLLAFTGLAGSFDIFTVNLATQEYRRLTQGQGTNKDPDFSPDCRMIAFYSSRGGIFLSNPEGLNQNLVIPGHAETLRWSR